MILHYPPVIDTPALVERAPMAILSPARLSSGSSHEGPDARRFTPVNGHAGKIPHSESEAWRIAKRFRSEGDAGMHAYHCKSCGSWHVGNDSLHTAAVARRSER